MAITVALTRANIVYATCVFGLCLDLCVCTLNMVWGQHMTQAALWNVVTKIFFLYFFHISLKLIIDISLQISPLWD